MAPKKKQDEQDHDEHDDHDHDHDHDHDDHEHEHDEEQDERDLERMTAALAALDDEALTTGLGSMTEKARIELADQLNLPRATMHLGEALIPLVRRKLRTATPDRKLQAGFALAERVNDTTVAALGDRSDDPSKEDLLEVLPGVLEAHNPALVTVLLANYAASDAPCGPAMREILETDDRFVIGPPVEVEPPPSALAPAPAREKDPAVAAKRKQRRAAKDAKREAEAREREARSGAEAKRRAAAHEAKRKAK